MNLYRRLRETGMGRREALWVCTTPMFATSLPIIYTAVHSDFTAQPYESAIKVGYAIGGGAVLGFLTFLGCMSITAANRAYQIGQEKKSLDDKVNSTD